MTIQSIVSHTPIWVWFLFIFLLGRGINALKPRRTSVLSMLILPILFFVWAVYGITSEMEYSEFSVTAFVTALVTGSGLGWALARAGEPVRLEAASGRIHRPGSPLTQILVLIGFSSKFALQTMLGHQPALAADPNFNILYGAIAGAVDGVFWGRTLLQLRQAFLNKAPSSHSIG